jgi:histone acetyltransferase (RNA polymerase elongator complex component)
VFKIKKHIVIPVFVPHKGCPFDCIFCNQKIISGQMHEADESEIRSNIENYLKTSGDAFVEIGFYGGSFTGISMEEQKKYLEIGYSYIKAGHVKEMRLSTRPDYISEEILNNLENYGVKTIELGSKPE